MTPPPFPTATYLDRWTVELRFPYNAQLVELIKKRIPASYRKFVPESKVWIIRSADPSWLRLAIDMMRGVYPHAKVVDEPRPDFTYTYRSTGGTSSGTGSGHTYWEVPPRRPVADPDYTALHLLPTAPPEVVAVVYRALSKLYHPDKGGSHERMLTINEAYENLRSRGAA